jgi:predicted nucleotidyltransferase
VDADVLYVVARAHLPMTGYSIEKASGRSHARVGEVLARLVHDGLLDAEEVGRSVTRYRLNREHVLAASIEAVAGAAASLEAHISDLAGQMAPSPEAVLLFGSFARRDGDSDSDIDLVVVRPEGIDADDADWLRARTGLAQAVEAAAGNSCQLVEVTSAQLADGAARCEPLIDSLRSDAVLLFGPKPASLVRRPLLDAR